MIAISLVLLTGWAGEISLGQVAFVAIGSAAAGAANVHWQLDPLLSFLLAGAVGAVASIIIGLPALRIRGLFLAVTTLAFAVMTSSFLLNRDQSVLGINFDYLPDELDHVTRFPQWTPFGHIGIGDAGLHTERSFYFMCVFCLLLVIVAVRGLQRSRTVRDLVAQRDNERNAQAFRLSPTKIRLLAFALSGFIASFAGGVLVLHFQALGQDVFAPGREHPGAHHGRGRRPRLGARRHPRRGVHQEHRVVQHDRSAALPVPVHLRRERHRADRRAVAAARAASDRSSTASATCGCAPSRAGGTSSCRRSSPTPATTPSCSPGRRSPRSRWRRTESTRPATGRSSSSGSRPARCPTSTTSATPTSG